MRRSFLITTFAALAIMVFSVIASAQTGQLRGHVLIRQADGTTVKGANAQIDVFRTDLPGNYPNKADKKGEFVYAGLQLVGTYIIAASAPGAAPYAIKGVKVGREIDYEIVLAGGGDGRRFSEKEAKEAVAGGGSGKGPETSSGGSTGGGESAADRAKREELLKKNAEIADSNKKIDDVNRIVGETFTAGNAALKALNYDEAIKQYDTGLAADPEQVALLSNKTLALKARGVVKYNAAIQDKDEAARNAGLESSKVDFKAAAEAANKAAELLKAQPIATAPDEKAKQDTNKYLLLVARAEAMRLYVTKADPTQADAGRVAFEEYIAVEKDPVKKAKAQLDLAQMLLDAGAADKALVEFQKILAETPDDPDANLGAGLALFGTGDKAKFQEAANFLQRFVDKAPDTHKFKSDAKAVLAELKSTENVVPERTTRPARKRP